MNIKSVSTIQVSYITYLLVLGCPKQTKNGIQVYYEHTVLKWKKYQKLIEKILISIEEDHVETIINCSGTLSKSLETCQLIKIQVTIWQLYHSQISQFSVEINL